jgi:hypothetical protein
VLLDNVMQIVRHGKHVALLALEQLKLLKEGVGDVSDHAAKAFLFAHGIRRKTPAESTRRGRRCPQTGGGAAGWCASRYPCVGNAVNDLLDCWFTAFVLDSKNAGPGPRLVLGSDVSYLLFGKTTLRGMTVTDAALVFRRALLFWALVKHQLRHSSQRLAERDSASGLGRKTIVWAS